MSGYPTYLPNKPEMPSVLLKEDKFEVTAVTSISENSHGATLIKENISI